MKKIIISAVVAVIVTLPFFFGWKDLFGVGSDVAAVAVVISALAAAFAYCEDVAIAIAATTIATATVFAVFGLAVTPASVEFALIGVATFALIAIPATDVAREENLKRWPVMGVYGCEFLFIATPIYLHLQHVG